MLEEDLGLKILFVSQYADPNLVGGNNNVYRQAKALKHGLGVDVEIMTWPESDNWSGPQPDIAKSQYYSYLNWGYEGLKYHVLKFPMKLIERVPKNYDWEHGIEIGCELLNNIAPSIVHLHHWRGLWWILESAKRLSIPAVYTSHDWGIGCLRTILVKGEGGLCDGIVDVEKCIACIWKGRSLIGKLNETIVSMERGERFIEMMARSVFEQWLIRHGAEQQGLHKRVNLNIERAKVVLTGLRALIVPSEFGKSFFRQFGVAEGRIHVEPWYYDSTVTAELRCLSRSKIVLGYIGRISPEKGVNRIFEALLGNSIATPIHLVIAGAIHGEYAERLHGRFKEKVGWHSVEWMGWIPHQDVYKFYEKVDAVIISSEWMDNTPLTLLESYAFKRPVIIPDIPTIRDLVHSGVTGYLTTFGSTESLEQAIRRLTLSPHDLIEMRNNIPPVRSSVAYANVLKNIYESINSESIPG